MLFSQILFLVLLIAVMVFAIGGVVWAFVQQHLQHKRYVKWIDNHNNNEEGI